MDFSVGDICWFKSQTEDPQFISTQVFNLFYGDEISASFSKVIKYLKRNKNKKKETLIANAFYSVD